MEYGKTTMETLETQLDILNKNDVQIGYSTLKYGVLGFGMEQNNINL